MSEELALLLVAVATLLLAFAAIVLVKFADAEVDRQCVAVYGVGYRQGGGSNHLCVNEVTGDVKYIK